MKRMNRPIKCLIAFFVMFLALNIACVTAEAKTKTYKINLYVGETSVQYPSVGKIKSVKTNNKKIVSAKKKGAAINLTAKKKGSAKITVKGSRGTYVYKVTVKNAVFDVTVGTSRTGNDDYLVTLENKTSDFFERVQVSAILRDTAGNPVEEIQLYFYAVGGKGKANSTFYTSTYDSTIDISKTTFTVVEFYRSTYTSYKNYLKNVNYSLTQVEEDTYSKKYRLTASTSYKGQGTVFVGYDVFFYDIAGNVVDVSSFYIVLNKNQRVYSDDISVQSSAVRAEIQNKRAYVGTY
ncbi:MAG: hypothetical protein NC124_01500 [Clostridium sp.]|nr:hypothetical protein [Clostridium sp.]